MTFYMPCHFTCDNHMLFLIAMSKLKEKKFIFNKKNFIQTNTCHFYRLMLYLFGSKIFSRKYFLYFLMFVQRKIRVNENHFQFNRKNLFNFWKTIYGFKNRNRFLDLNSSFFQTRLWKSVTSGHWSLLVARIYSRRSPNFGIRSPDFVAGNRRQNPANPDSGKIGQNLATAVGFWPSSPESSESGWNPVGWWNLISSNFFIRAKRWKIFSNK
jgi:hypothetical protein